LSQLLSLFSIKFAIFAYGLFNNGGPQFNRNGRSMGGSPSAVNVLSPTDMTGGLCFLSFASSGDPAKLSCLRRAACEDPETAHQYIEVAHMWKMASKMTDMVPFAAEYGLLADAVEEAAKHSVVGGDCSVYPWS